MRRWTPLFIAALAATGIVIACGGGSSGKAIGESCVSSTECATGLVCDLGQTPAICAENSTQRPDAPDEPDIDAPLIDGSVDRPDAPPDAAPDAPPDAPPDTM